LSSTLALTPRVKLGITFFQPHLHRTETETETGMQVGWRPLKNNPRGTIKLSTQSETAGGGQSIEMIGLCLFVPGLWKKGPTSQSVSRPV
jgi:hypothetical protein